MHADLASLTFTGARLRVLVRVDASSEIGLGHAMRCTALIEAMREMGHHVGVATVTMPAALVTRWEALGVAVSWIGAPVGSAADAIHTTTIAEAQQCDWVIADGYHFGLDWQLIVRTARTHVAMFDDEARADRWLADLLINQNHGATAAMYHTSAPRAMVCAGASFALLRNAFRSARATPHTMPARAQRLLLTLGGADPANLTSRFIPALSAHDGLDVRVVLGAVNPHRDAVLAAIAAHAGPATFTVLEHVEDMPAHMLWADLAITAGGSTLWELACLGVPSLVVVLAENQRPGATACVAAGMARSLGDADTFNEQAVSAIVAEVIGDAAARHAMSHAGRQLVDGQGAYRVVEALQQVVHHATAGQAAATVPETTP